MKIINFAKKHKLLTLFVATFVIHAVFVAVMSIFNLQPFFSGGDDAMYNRSAVEIAQEFRRGNFSLETIKTLHPDVYLLHFYPVLIGVIYAIFSSNLILGELFNAFLCALVSVFVYLIITELSGSATKALAVGFIVSLYPSLALNGTLLLKDALTTCLSLAILFLIIKLIKNFSFWQFALLYLLFIPIINLRFYLGYALMLAFVVCWFLFCKNKKLKTRVFYIIIIIFIFGFLPQISVDQGYWGMKSFQQFINVKAISFYREVAYISPVISTPSVANKTCQPSMDGVSINKSSIQCGTINPSGTGSTLNIKTDLKHPLSFLINYSESFIYVLLGPFPWQTKSLREKLALLETVPWYFLFYFAVVGAATEIKKKNTLISPLIVFGIIFLSVVSLFDVNFGNFMRTRIPAFISFLCLVPFGFNKNNILYNYLNNIYEKVFGYWRGRVHRFQHS